VLVTGEIAAALFLLIGTGLLIRGIYMTEHQKLGFRPDHLLTASLTLDDAHYKDASQRAIFVRDVIPRLKQIPGAEGVAVTSDLPATGPGSVNFRIQGESEPQANQLLNVLDSVVSTEFFRTSGIPLLRGRTFTDMDNTTAPRVIVARVQPGATPDLAALRARVLQVAPSASVDDHRAWIERMRSMTGATVFLGIGILALVIIATIISVSFATRGAMAANRPIVEVLHFVGAGDSYIANRFLRHFLRLGLEGGLIGGGVAMLGFGFSESIASWFSGTPVGDQFAALLGTFSLRPSGYLVLAAQAVLIAAITAWASRRTLFATLDDID
jgi:hypothetical protein